jgi:hypothetical protein
VLGKLYLVAAFDLPPEPVGGDDDDGAIWGILLSWQVAFGLVGEDGLREQRFAGEGFAGAGHPRNDDAGRRLHAALHEEATDRADGGCTDFRRAGGRQSEGGRCRFQALQGELGGAGSRLIAGRDAVVRPILGRVL